MRSGCARTGVAVSAACSDASRVPFFTERVSAAVTVDQQAFIDPGDFVQQLAASARSLGVAIEEGTEVSGGEVGNRRSVLFASESRRLRARTIVLAPGAWTDLLVARCVDSRLRLGVVSGRGYSFTAEFSSADADSAAATALRQGPVYLPEVRTVCSPRIAMPFEWPGRWSSLRPTHFQRRRCGGASPARRLPACAALTSRAEQMSGWVRAP